MINSYIEEFLKDSKHQEMINKNKFRELYEECSENMRGYLTEILLKVNIDPCLYFTSGVTSPFMFSKYDDRSEYQVPTNIHTIIYSTFKGAISLKKVILPKSIKSIENFAFYKSSVTDIDYLGTKQEFTAIQRELDAFTKSNFISIHCSDGDLQIKKHI